VVFADLTFIYFPLNIETILLQNNLESADFYREESRWFTSVGTTQVSIKLETM